MALCPWCSLGCRAGLRLGGPDWYLPDYPEAADGGDYAGLCARGSMMAELTNHRDRLLWPLVARDGRLVEARLPDTLGRAAGILRGPAADGRLYAFLDGNFPLESLARAVAALRQLVPAERVALSLPQADTDLLAGCETSGADYAAPAQLADADAIFVVGNPFATHPVVAHWMLDLDRGRDRRPLMVLGATAGVTGTYATHLSLVPPGREHLALAAVANALGVRGCETGTEDIDPAAMKAWADALTKADRPALVVAAEFGRAARWFEIGLLAGEIARIAGGRLLPLAVTGNALGSLRLASQLGLADWSSLRAAATEDAGSVVLALGEGLASRVAGDGSACVAAASLRPKHTAACDVVLPMAWPFETAGTVLLPGVGPVESESAVRPPSGVPALDDLAAELAGGPGDAVTDFASLAAVRRGRVPDLSPLNPAGGDGDGLVVVLAGDGVNFADGAVTRRVSFAAQVLPDPAVALSEADARALGAGDGDRVRLSGAGAEVTARVEVREGQPAGQAALAGAYGESQQLVRAACGDGPPKPIRVRAERAAAGR